ncbi:YciI family protein [Actinoplanes sp. NBC_00393]|uniref:YciI family protein n=1 Tax=Actinoplanes sp. NBC_00393 TaxID=2975953 RepID=UPI002E1F33F0
MWIIELRFLPTPERLAARPAHRSHLTALHHENVVRMAGPLAGDAGAVIVVEAPDRKAVDSLIAADPYFATAGVDVVQIREWEPFLQ